MNNTKSKTKIFIITCHPVNDGRLLKHYNFLNSNYSNPEYVKIRWLDSEDLSKVPENWFLIDLPVKRKIKKRISLLTSFFSNVSIVEEINNQKINGKIVLIHIHDPNLIPLACLLKFKFNNVRIIYDRHEYHPFNCVSLSSIETWLYERILLKFFDGVIVVTEEMKEELQRIRGFSSPIDIVPNYPSTVFFDKKKIYGKKIMNGDSIRFVYFGTLSKYDRNIRLILECSDKILSNFPNAFVVIGGRNISKEDLEFAERLKEKFPEQFSFLGEVSYDRVVEETQKAHFGFLTLSPQKNTSYKGRKISSNKIYEYLFCGVIPLISEGNFSIDIPKDYYISLEEDYISSIKKNLTSDKLRKEILQYGASFSWEIVCEKYKSMYVKLEEKFKIKDKK